MNVFEGEGDEEVLWTKKNAALLSWLSSEMCREKVVGVEVQMISLCGKMKKEKEEERVKDDTRTCRYFDGDCECFYLSEGMRREEGVKIRSYYSCEKCSNNNTNDKETTRKTMFGKVSTTKFVRSTAKNILKKGVQILEIFKWMFLLILLTDKKGKLYTEKKIICKNYK